jgi:hypothetical protein
LQIPQTWNRYSYTLNNPLRFRDPNGAEHSDAIGKELEKKIISDPTRTPAEKRVVGDQAESSLELKTKVMNDACIVIAPQGEMVSEGDKLAPGELRVVGDADAVESMHDKLRDNGRNAVYQYGGTAPERKSGEITGATRFIFKGSIEKYPKGRTLQQGIEDTFIHEDAHFTANGILRSEPEVQELLRGTPSR